MRRCYGCMHEFADEFELCPHCGFIVGTAPEVKSHLPCGTKLSGGRYILGKVLGHGGFGITYIAWDSKRNRPVAIKEFFPNALSTRSEGESIVSCYNSKSEKFFKEGVKKMLDEGERLSKFYKNESIVNVYDYFEANKTAYIVMEYLEGKDLKKYLEENGGKLDIDEAIEIILPVLNALNDMHKENLIHRDISPDNIFICNNGKVKILDFGSARLAVQDADKSMSIMLKKGYAPKEQYSSRSKQGPWTDVYAVSATLYELVTGHKPVDSMERDEEPIKSFKELGVLGRGELENIILKGMEPEVADRTPDAATLYAQLAEIIKPADSSKPDFIPKPPKITAPVKTKKNGKKTLIIAALLAVVVTAGAIGVKFASDRFSAKPEETTTSAVVTTTETETTTEPVSEVPMLTEAVPALENVSGMTKTEILNTLLGENKNVYMVDINGDENSEILLIEKAGENGVEEDAVWAYTTLADGSMVKSRINCSINSQFLADTENNALYVVLKNTKGADGIEYSATKFTVSDTGFMLADNISSKETEDMGSYGATLDAVEKDYNEKFKTLVAPSAPEMLVDIKTLNSEGKCGDKSEWVYHKGGKLLRIFGSDAIDGYNSEHEISPWEDIASDAELISIADTITCIGRNSFSNFINLKEIYIGTSVNSVETGAFEKCSSLKSIRLDGVRTVESWAFLDSGIEEIHIGKSLKNDSVGSFFAPNLKKITVDSLNDNYYSDSSGVLYKNDMTELVQYPAGSDLKKYTVSLNTYTISSNSFKDAENLEEIFLPDALSFIEETAFGGCTSLIRINIPGNVATVPEYCFTGCSSLESVVLEEGVKVIKEFAFLNCSSLMAVSVPSTLTTIEESAFHGCIKVSEFKIPSSVTSVGANAFKGWTSSQKIYVDKKTQECSSWKNWSGGADVEYKDSNPFGNLW